MFYLQTVCNFLVAYDWLFLCSAFVGTWCFGAINWLCDGYSKQNAMLNECGRNVLARPQFKSMYLAKVSEEYSRQWRAYVNSGALRPSLTFEFVPHKKKLSALPLFVACAAVSAVYVALFFLFAAKREYVVFQAAFWLAFVVVVLVNDVLFKKKEGRARRVFGKFVAQLNASERAQNNVDNNKSVSKEKDALGKVSDLLRRNASTCRTTQQQQKINKALNGLLQAYSKDAAKSQK